MSAIPEIGDSRCAVCGAVRSGDRRHKHEMSGWKPAYDDFEGALEGYETVGSTPSGRFRTTPREGEMRNEQQQTQGTYAIRVRCGNCNDEQRVDIPRGQAIDETPCPTCGCKRLARAFLTSGWRS